MVLVLRGCNQIQGSLHGKKTYASENTLSFLHSKNTLHVRGTVYLITTFHWGKTTVISLAEHTSSNTSSLEF